MKFPWVRDELILALNLYFEHGILDSEMPQVRELSKLLNRLEIHERGLRDSNFRSPASVALKLANLANHDPKRLGKKTNGGHLDGVVFHEWFDRQLELKLTAAAIEKLASEPSFEVSNIDLEFEAHEGKLLTAAYFKRERNRVLRDKKIKSVIDLEGQIRCEVCFFDFGTAYGKHGLGYIECHHVTPLHVSGPVRTKLSDLVLLCSNCHRMIHRKSPWLTLEQLRKLVSQQASHVNLN
jgi:5-methylcytosine-specific restriction protein A